MFTLKIKSNIIYKKSNTSRVPRILSTNVSSIKISREAKYGGGKGKMQRNLVVFDPFFNKKNPQLGKGEGKGGGGIDRAWRWRKFRGHASS